LNWIKFAIPLWFILREIKSAEIKPINLFQILIKLRVHT